MLTFYATLHFWPMAPAKLYFEEIYNLEGVRQFRVHGRDKSVVFEKLNGKWTLVEGKLREAWQTIITGEIDRHLQNQQN